MSIITNAAAIAARMQARARKLESAVTRGLRKIVTQVDREQIKRLGGSNALAPGAYPVPARTGHLRRETFFEMRSDTLAVAGNSARYAATIHEGKFSSEKYGPRPFLTDAVLAVDAGEIMAVEVRKALDVAA